MSGFVSMLLLILVGVVCTWGVFSKHMDDNLAQRLGMSMLAVWCFARLPVKWETMNTEPVHLLLHFALACYAGGTWWKLTHSQTGKRKREARQLCQKT